MEKVTHFMSSVAESNTTAQSNNTQTGQSGYSNTDCLVITSESIKPSLCVDPDDLVTQETRLLIEGVVYIGLVPLLTVLGVVLNAMNMAVFVKQGLGDRVRLSMFSLSLADLLVLTSMCLQYISKLLAQIFGRDWERKEWLAPLLRYHLVNIPIGFQMVSIFISTMIAVDRCVCVTWPLKAARVLSTRVTAVAIIVCSVLAFAGKQFGAFKFDVGCAVLAGKNVRISMVVPSDLYRSIPQIMDILDSFVLSTLVPNLSLLLTAVATAITAIKLKRATQWRDSTTGRYMLDMVLGRRALDKVFAEFGMPHTLKTDNGPPFNSHDLAAYCNHQGTHYRKITPELPRANGETERFMRTVKKVVKSSTLPNFRQDLHHMLTAQRGDQRVTRNSNFFRPSPRHPTPAESEEDKADPIDGGPAQPDTPHEHTAPNNHSFC
ncbi:uncharacterized protein LOC143282578 [Babylonia areolata]|uniref:uncharacterized protein LOC143282578 n=1 Tax=Babylonia areolata TaxID=304850 RepID=UPI003FD52493